MRSLPSWRVCSFAMLSMASLLSIVKTKSFLFGRYLQASSSTEKPCPEQFNETFMYPFNSSVPEGRALPVPVQIMHEYMRQHSVDAIRKDPHLERRRYAIAFYQCPLSAGNNLHRFFNGVLWSILTNRTLLVKYWTTSTCKTYGLQTYTISQCNACNQQCECDQIITKAPWMASYDEFKDLIGDGPYMIPYHATMGRTRDSPRFPVPDNYEESYGVDLASKYPQKLVIFPFCYSKFWQLGNATLQNELLKMTWARERVESLYSLGPEFLYGMLHRYTFQFAEAVRSSVPDSVSLVNQQQYTIALHSRHRFDALDGCDISREIDCLEKLLRQRDNQTSPVQVRVMSDRPCTVSRLTDWLEQRNHSIMTAQHSSTSPSNLMEHGPFAGIGYFQDLALVSSARSAFVAMARSSSDLLRELLIFNGAVELWHAGVDLDLSHTLHVVDRCILPYQADPTPDASTLDARMEQRMEERMFGARQPNALNYFESLTD